MSRTPYELQPYVVTRLISPRLSAASRIRFHNWYTQHLITVCGVRTYTISARYKFSARGPWPSPAGHRVVLVLVRGGGRVYV